VDWVTVVGVFCIAINVVRLLHVLLHVVMLLLICYPLFLFFVFLHFFLLSISFVSMLFILAMRGVDDCSLQVTTANNNHRRYCYAEFVAE